MSPEVMQKTFNNIALSLSGGGYRAAAFHFGTMQMLSELGLLENVKMFSTASGGTITAVAYVNWCVTHFDTTIKDEEKDDFSAFCEKFEKFLREFNIVERAFQKAIKADRPEDQNTDKNISLIKLAAEVYEKGLFQDKEPVFGDLFKIVGTDKPFTDIIFNSTEFKQGNNFRFRASFRKGADIGNPKFNLEASEDVAEQIRLSDIIAASACFPGVFDPFKFPDDFHFTEDIEVIKGKLKSGFKDKDNNNVHLPLMDGGIFDNQGIDSILLATYDEGKEKKDKSKPRPEPIDLFILSDSNPRNNDLLANLDLDWLKSYIPEDHIEKKPPEVAEGLVNKITTPIKWGILAASGFLGLSMIYLIYTAIIIFERAYVFQDVLSLIFSYAVPAVLLLLVSILCIIAVIVSSDVSAAIQNKKKYFDNFEDIKVGGTTFSVGTFAKSATLSELFSFLINRFTSTAVMVTDVFLKRIRGLGIKVIMNDRRYNGRVAFNYIYDLDCSINRPTLWENDKRLRPTKKMSEISLKAEKYSTNLWFPPTKDLDNLIECGRMTVCLSLLVFIWRKWAIEKNKIEDFNEQNPKSLKLPPPPKPTFAKSPYYRIYNKILDKWIELKGEDLDCPEIKKDKVTKAAAEE